MAFILNKYNIHIISTPKIGYAFNKSLLIFSFGKESLCAKHECWCVSAGGTSCAGLPGGVCSFPNECHDKVDCPGNGYWCSDTGK